MKHVAFRGRVVLLLLGGLLVSASLLGLQPVVHSGSPDLPDLVPYGLADFAVGRQLGGLTFEFSILTANIGGQDYVRPRDPRTGAYLLRQIYEYALYQYSEDVGDYVEVDRRRKNTICTIDDTRRGNRVFPCLTSRTTPQFFCGGPQGVSLGWADDYFRGLTGQFVFLGDRTGDFLLEAHLDPDGDLLRDDIPDSGKDSNPDNNWAYIYFSWDGASGQVTEIDYSFDPASVCPSNE